MGMIEIFNMVVNKSLYEVTTHKKDVEGGEEV